MRATANVAGTFDREFYFVDAVISTNEALEKALKEARETGQDIDALYAAANSDVITTIRHRDR